MKKLNRKYLSLFEYLANNYGFFQWIEKKLYPEYYPLHLKLQIQAVPIRRYNPTPDDNTSWQFIMGGLQPIMDMGKDIVDTFKPYKSSYYIWRDLIQPIRGIGNILKGIATLVVSPLFFLFNTVKYLCRLCSDRNPGRFWKNMRGNCVKTTGWLLDGVSSIIRGITQIAATPLTWARILFIRGPLTIWKGYQKIEDNPGMQELTSINQEASYTSYINHHMYRKFMKARGKGQGSDFEHMDLLDNLPLMLIMNEKVDNPSFYKSAVYDIGVFMQKHMNQTKRATPIAQRDISPNMSFLHTVAEILNSRL